MNGCCGCDPVDNSEEESNQEEASEESGEGEE